MKKTLLLLPLAALVTACASSNEEKDPLPVGQGDRAGFQITAGSPNTVDCPSRNSTCYAQVRRACGELGVEEVHMMGEGQVVTAGRSGSTDDPFARADRNRGSNTPVTLRCKAPKDPPPKD